MPNRYGVPYQGSKNGIARDIVAQMPPGPVLVDLFAGGCAVTHAALEACESLCPKWGRIISNDIDPMPGELFRRAVSGELAQETRWISREDFFLLKDADPYVRYCWSFGNIGVNYLYSQEVEPWKRALHHAYVQGNTALLESMGGALPDEVKRNGMAALRRYIQENETTIKAYYIDWYRSEFVKQHAEFAGLPELFGERLEEETAVLAQELRGYLRQKLQESGLRAVDVDRHLGTNGMAGHYFGASQWEFPTPEAYAKLKEILPLDRGYPFHWAFLQSLQSLQSLQRLQSLQSLQRLQRLQSLQSLQSLQRLEQECGDYRNARIPDGAVVYCDIPYEGTNCDAYAAVLDHAAFREWACETAKRAQVYVSSYQIDDSRFECVWEKEKACLLPSCGAIKRVERLYKAIPAA